MGSLFGGATPTIQREKPKEQPNDEELARARKRKQVEISQRTGRESTFLSGADRNSGTNRLGG